MDLREYAQLKFTMAEILRGTSVIVPEPEIELRAASGRSVCAIGLRDCFAADSQSGNR